MSQNSTVSSKIFLTVNIIYSLCMVDARDDYAGIEAGHNFFFLVSIIIPNFRTIYVLDVPTEDVRNDNNDTSNQKSSDSGLEKMRLIAQFKPTKTSFWQRMDTIRSKNSASLRATVVKSVPLITAYIVWRILNSDQILQTSAIYLKVD